MRVAMTAGNSVRGNANVLAGQAPGSSPWGFSAWMKVLFWLLLAIAVAAVLRRAVALPLPVSGRAPAQMASLDAEFKAYAALTWVHITCALVFVLLLPFLFRRVASVRLERAFFVLGAAVGATAFAMSSHAVGGWLERSAVLVFNTLFLFSLSRAFVLARHGDHLRKRRWMLRATAILLGIATTRPVMGVFFATSSLTNLTPQQFFGMAFWIGFSINTLGIELWLRTRAAARAGDHA